MKTNHWHYLPKVSCSGVLNCDFQPMWLYSKEIWSRNWHLFHLPSHPATPHPSLPPRHGLLHAAHEQWGCYFRDASKWWPKCWSFCYDYFNGSPWFSSTLWSCGPTMLMCSSCVSVRAAVARRKRSMADHAIINTYDVWWVRNYIVSSLFRKRFIVCRER